MDVILFVCVALAVVSTILVPFLISLLEEKKKAKEQNKDQEQKKE